MIFISTTAFDESDIARLQQEGGDYYYAGNVAADPHGASSDEFAAGIYALPEAVRMGARVLIMPCFHVTPRLLEACPDVGWVQHPGAGVNSGRFWTDWEMLERHHVVVTTAKIHALPISEMIVTFMLMLSKHMSRYHERQRSRIYHNEEHLRAIIMDGRTALILGTGHVGSETARKLKLGFHMTTIGINSDGRPLSYFDETHTLAGLDSVLPRADYVICTSVLVEDTLGMINAERIALMKPSAFIINPSRGGLIVEQDLIEALETRRIAGAGLDTFDVEPLAEDSPLWGLDNVVLTPHVSGGRPGYNTAVMDRLLANLDAFSQGRVDRMVEVANIKRY